MRRPTRRPSHVLGLEHGEAAVIRNVGGRITPETLRTMALLSKVGQANAAGAYPGDWNLVIVHHTDCGMTDLEAFPDLLAQHFEIPASEIPAKAASDPHRSIHVDVDVVLAELSGGSFFVSGLLYDVATGLVEIMVPPTPLPASRPVPS